MSKKVISPLEIGPCFFCGADTPIPVRTFQSKELKILNQNLSLKNLPPFPIPDGKVSVVRCGSCGLVYQNPRPSPEILMEFYNMMYSDFGEKATGKEFEAYKLDSPDQDQNRLRKVHKLVRPPGKLLDVGAGRGHFLHHARKSGWEVYGLEFSKVGAEFAKSRYQLEIRVGELKDAGFENEMFDVITMFSVLEHVLDPAGLVRDIYKKLKPGGALIFNVPNTNSLELKMTDLLVGEKYDWFCFEHLHYYNPTLIKKFLQKENFEVVSITSAHGGRDPYLENPRVETQSRTLKGKLFSFLLLWMKSFLEYSDIGGRLNLGNVIVVSALKKR